MTRALTVLVAVAALGVAVVALTRHTSSSTAAEGVTVAGTSLRPGVIELTLRTAAAPARIAQVIVNDAYVDFRARRARESTVIAIDYPWIRGESYEIEILTSRGIVEDEIERAGENA